MLKVTDKYVIFFKEWPSNFRYSPFTTEGLNFSWVEQYFMWKKAITFNDDVIAKMILLAQSPQQARSLGRKVRGYDDVVWAGIREQVMEEGSLLKYRQNPELRSLLTAQEYIGKHYVEANPYDTIWSVGVDKEKAIDPNNWRGQNKLGHTLDKVRQILISE